LDFGDRILDTRIGRWFSVDNMEGKYSSLSPYNSFRNNPMFFIDPDGNEIEPWKWTRGLFGYKLFGPFYSFSNLDNSDIKFDKSYHSLMNNSKVFRKVISRLKNSSRTYRFQEAFNNALNKNKYEGELGHFDPNPKGSKEDPFTINIVVDEVNGKTYSDNKAVIFEETFHAAQNDYYLDTKLEQTSLATEVEAKLVKNIEGQTSDDPKLSYEIMTFKGKKEIFEAIKTGKKLTNDQKNVLGKAINDLAKEVSDAYGGVSRGYDINSYNSGTGLDFAEKLYNQELTNELHPMIINNNKKNNKR
jgi:hypothetical protein